MKNKILSVLLILSLIISMAAVPAAAWEGESDTDEWPVFSENFEENEPDSTFEETSEQQEIELEDISDDTADEQEVSDPADQETADTEPVTSEQDVTEPTASEEETAENPSEEQSSEETAERETSPAETSSEDASSKVDETSTTGETSTGDETSTSETETSSEEETTEEQLHDITITIIPDISSIEVKTFTVQAKKGETIELDQALYGPYYTNSFQHNKPVLSFTYYSSKIENSEQDNGNEAADSTEPSGEEAADNDAAAASSVDNAGESNNSDAAANAVTVSCEETELTDYTLTGYDISFVLEKENVTEITISFDSSNMLSVSPAYYSGIYWDSGMSNRVIGISSSYDAKYVGMNAWWPGVNNIQRSGDWTYFYATDVSELKAGDVILFTDYEDEDTEVYLKHMCIVVEVDTENYEYFKTADGNTDGPACKVNVNTRWLGSDGFYRYSYNGKFLVWRNTGTYTYNGISIKISTLIANHAYNMTMWVAEHEDTRYLQYLGDWGEWGWCYAYANEVLMTTTGCGHLSIQKSVLETPEGVSKSPLGTVFALCNTTGTALGHYFVINKLGESRVADVYDTSEYTVKGTACDATAYPLGGMISDVTVYDLKGNKLDVSYNWARKIDNKWYCVTSKKTLSVPGKHYTLKEIGISATDNYVEDLNTYKIYVDPDGSDEDNIISVESDLNICEHNNVTYVAKKAATYTAKGNKAYYYCHDCGRYSLTKDFSSSVKLSDTVIDYLKPVKPVLSSCVTESGCATIKWAAADGANSYKVYRKVSSGSWTCIAENVTARSYKDTTISEGQTYYYSVSSYNTTSKKSSSYDKTGVFAVKLSSCTAIIGNIYRLANIKSFVDSSSVVLSSSKKSVATFDSNGAAHAVGCGEAYLYIKSSDGKSVSKCKITVLFKDIVKLNTGFQKAILWASDSGIAKGYDDGNFGEANKCTRKQFIIMLYRLAGKPSVSGSMPFTDCKNITKDSDTYKAIIWGYQKGYISGYSNGTFRPDEPVTRKQVLIMLYRYAGCPKISGTLTFTDCKYSTSSTSYKAILWGTKNDITNGTSSTTFSPDSNCLRRQIALFLYKYHLYG